MMPSSREQQRQELAAELGRFIAATTAALDQFEAALLEALRRKDKDDA
jgi:hypothetical protein